MILNNLHVEREQNGISETKLPLFVRILLLSQSYLGTTYGQPDVEDFLSQLKNGSFTISQKPYSKLSKKDSQAIRSLADDCNSVTKIRGSDWCVVV